MLAAASPPRSPIAATYLCRMQKRRSRDTHGRKGPRASFLWPRPGRGLHGTIRLGMEQLRNRNRRYERGREGAVGTLCIRSKTSYFDLILSPETCLGSFCSADMSQSSVIFLQKEILTPKPLMLSIIRALKSRTSFWIFHSDISPDTIMYLAHSYLY